MACRVLLAATVGWPSVARLAGGFGMASCTVDALSPGGAPVVVSRYLSHHYVYNPLFPLSSLRDAIVASNPDLVVPGDDRAVAYLLRLHAEARADAHNSGAIAELIERSLGKPESYPEMMSRNRFMTVAKELGIRVPKTVPVASEAEIDACLAEVGLPAVLKSDGSWGGDGVVVVRSRDEALAAFRRLAHPPSRLRSVARALRRRDAHYLLSAVAPSRQAVSMQQFIEGRPAASAFASWKGEVIGRIYYDVVVAQGTIGPPNVIKRVDCEEIDEATRRVARHFGLSGLHGMDFIRDASGAVHLLEINPRATQGGTVAFGPGRGLPAALASRIVPAIARPAIANDVVVFFPREWLRDPSSPYLKTGYHDVPWDDPAVLRACLQSQPGPQPEPAKPGGEQFRAALTVSGADTGLEASR
jgi:hypothetical protein